MAAKTAESPGSLLASARSRAQEAAEDIRSLLDQLRTLSPRLTELFKNSKCAFPEPETSCNDEQREVGFLAWYSACAAACRDTVRERLLTLCGDPSSQQFSPEQNGGIEDVALLAKADYVYWWKKQPEVPIKPKLLNEVEEESESTEEEQRDEQTAQDLMQNLKMLEVDLDEERAASLETEASFTIKKSRNIEIKPNDQSSADRIHNAITSARPELKIAMNSNSKVLTIQFKKQSVKGNEQSHLNQQRIDAFLAKAEEICKLAGQEIAKGKSHRERKAEYAREQLESIQLELPKYHLPPAKQQVLTNKVLNRLAMIDYIQKEKAFDQWVEKANSAFADFEKIQPVDIRHAERIDSDVNSIVETVSLLRERVQSAISAMDSDTFFGTLQKADKSIASVVEEAEQLYAEAVREEAKAREGVGGGRKKSRKRGKRKGERRGGVEEEDSSTTPNSRKIPTTLAYELARNNSILRPPLTNSSGPMQFAERKHGTKYLDFPDIPRPKETLSGVKMVGYILNRCSESNNYRFEVRPVTKSVEGSLEYTMGILCANFAKCQTLYRQVNDFCANKKIKNTIADADLRVQLREAMAREDLTNMDVMSKSNWYRQGDVADIEFASTLREVVLELGHFYDDDSDLSNKLEYCMVVSTICSGGLKIALEQYIQQSIDTPPENFSPEAIRTIIAIETYYVSEQAKAYFKELDPQKALSTIQKLIVSAAKAMASPECEPLEKLAASIHFLQTYEVMVQAEKHLMSIYVPDLVKNDGESSGKFTFAENNTLDLSAWNFDTLNFSKIPLSEDEQKILREFCTAATGTNTSKQEDPANNEQREDSFEQLYEASRKAEERNFDELRTIVMEYVSTHYQGNELPIKKIADDVVDAYEELYTLKKFRSLLLEAQDCDGVLDEFAEDARNTIYLELQQYGDPNVQLRSRIDKITGIHTSARAMRLIHTDEFNDLHNNFHYVLMRATEYEPANLDKYRKITKRLLSMVSNGTIKDYQVDTESEPTEKLLVQYAHKLSEYCDENADGDGDRLIITDLLVHMLRAHIQAVYANSDSEEVINDSPEITEQTATIEEGTISIPLKGSKELEYITVDLSDAKEGEREVDPEEIIEKAKSVAPLIGQVCNLLPLERSLRFVSDTDERAKDYVSTLHKYTTELSDYITILDICVRKLQSHIETTNDEYIAARAAIWIQILSYTITAALGEHTKFNHIATEHQVLDSELELPSIETGDIDRMPEDEWGNIYKSLRLKVLLGAVTSILSYQYEFERFCERTDTEYSETLQIKAIHLYKAQGVRFAETLLDSVSSDALPELIPKLDITLNSLLRYLKDQNSYSERIALFFFCHTIACKLSTIISESARGLPEDVQPIPNDTESLLIETHEFAKNLRKEGFRKQIESQLYDFKLVEYY